MGRAIAFQLWGGPVVIHAGGNPDPDRPLSAIEGRAIRSAISKCDRPARIGVKSSSRINT